MCYTSDAHEWNKARVAGTLILNFAAESFPDSDDTAREKSESRSPMRIGLSFAKIKYKEFYFS